MESLESIDSLVYDNVYQIVYGALNPGKLKLQGSSLAFKSKKTGNVEKANCDEVSKALWSRSANGCCLELILSSGKNLRFCGFDKSDSTKIKQHFSTTTGNSKFQEQKRDVSGRNFGKIEFDVGITKFMISDKPAFNVPLSDICSSSIGKNEVNLCFHQSDSSALSLMEMRFHIPSGIDEEGNELTESINEKILEHADVIQATGDAVISLPEISCLTPRGRYSVKIYPSFIQLHGKSYDFKIPCSSILRIFLLPHSDPSFVILILSMDPPVRQGQTRYPFIVCQLDITEEITIKLHIPPVVLKSNVSGKSLTSHDLTAEKFGSLLDSSTSEMNGPLYEVISTALKAVVGRKITIPGSFKTTSDQKSISCHHRASSGLLYPLERSFLFVHKPTVHVRFEEIVYATFSRGLASSRSFDFELSLNNGSNVSFSTIVRENYAPLFDFISSKGIKVTSSSDGASSSMKFTSNNPNWDEFDDEEDMKDSNWRKTAAAGSRNVKDSFEEGDSDDEEDVDFVPNVEIDEINGAESKIKDEFDSNPSTTTDAESESDSDTN